MVGNGPEYRLEIPNAKLDFTGTYTVYAKNEHGDAKAIISLQIFARGKLSNKEWQISQTHNYRKCSFPFFYCVCSFRYQWQGNQ